jgi:hypothetical protein
MDSMRPLLIILLGEYLKAINDVSSPITKISNYHLNYNIRFWEKKRVANRN